MDNLTQQETITLTLTKGEAVAVSNLLQQVLMNNGLSIFAKINQALESPVNDESEEEIKIDATINK